MSRIFIPGFQTNTTSKVSYYKECSTFTCPKPVINTIKLNNGIVNPNTKQSHRITNGVNYYLGGRTQFGNVTNTGPSQFGNMTNTGTTQFGNANNARTPRTLLTYLGKTEGQPGGISGPLRNKF